MKNRLSNIPVTLVTGLLGAGKTTLIDHLLEQRPRDQRWAVLVNEFSETGVDGARLAREGVYLREVAGGCMGCSAALMLQVELNRLLREAQPHRLLVEPTGLGHPMELLQFFQGENYREVLSPRATICLLDARRLSEQKFLDSPLWDQQKQSADVLLGSKADLWTPEDRAAFDGLCAEQSFLACGIVPAAGGRFDTAWLDAPAGSREAAARHDHHHGHSHDHDHESGPQVHDLAFAPDASFDADTLRSVLQALNCERVKGSVQGTNGPLRVDGTNGEINIAPEPHAPTNRLQVIGGSQVHKAELEQRMLRAAASR
ncbi:CobW family GTP-binding protein [Algiphilus sp.]|uniref:CobW family GTP-binding protein n=1 Tax=Algiphilus sp. TaxID=1872431 RepID=UPI003B52BBBB